MQPRAGRTGAAERAGVGMTTVGWRLDVRGPVESREYILNTVSPDVHALSVCVWGVYAVSLRVCGVSFFGTPLIITRPQLWLRKAEAEGGR